MDAVAAYVRRFPDVKVELQMLDRTVNLVDERIDLAIRTSNDVDPSLIARRLSVCRSVVCAAPAYLNERGTPQRVEELSLHNCLTHAYFGHSLWHFAVAGQQVAVPVSGNISANEVMTLQGLRWLAQVSPCCQPTRPQTPYAGVNWCVCCLRPNRVN